MYDYIIIGAGISGCSTAYHLSKHSNSILLIDKEDDVAFGASGAAGAFLSPLLGKPNNLKDLVNDALIYSTNLYKDISPASINQCGTLRIPKDEEARKQFNSYKQYMDFDYNEEDGGYFFKIASVVDAVNVCKILTKDIKKQFNHEVKSISFKDNIWSIDNKYKAKSIIMTTGACINLIDEKYLNIRAVWGQKITIQTSTCITKNYHKECSISQGVLKSKDTYISSIGATHHRNVLDKKIDKDDTTNLLEKANGIINLKDVKVIDEKAGARACSIDYLPIVGDIINSEKTIEKFPYLKNGTNVQSHRFNRYEKLFFLNGVGGRGFVLAPYLAKILVDNIVHNTPIDEKITTNRLFKKWVKKLNR